MFLLILWDVQHFSKVAVSTHTPLLGTPLPHWLKRENVFIVFPACFLRNDSSSFKFKIYFTYVSLNYRNVIYFLTCQSSNSTLTRLASSCDR